MRLREKSEIRETLFEEPPGTVRYTILSIEIRATNTIIHFSASGINRAAEVFR